MNKFSKEFYASRIEDWITKYIKVKELCKLIKSIKNDIEKNGGQVVLTNDRNPSLNFEEYQRVQNSNISQLDRHSVGLSVLEGTDGLFNKNEKIFQTPLMFEINEMFTELKELEFADDMKIFLYFLTIEVHNVYVFYLSIEKNIFMRINEHSNNRKKYATMSEKELLDELVDLTDITYLMYSFYSYIDLNVQAVQEILKYFDNHFQIINHNICMSKLYFKKYLTKKESDLKYILSFKIIIESCALIESYYHEIIKINNSSEIKAQKKELKEVLSYLNEKNTDRVNDEIHEVYLKQRDIHYNNIIKQRKNVDIDIQNSFCIDVHQQEDFYKRLGEKQYDEEIKIRTTRKNIWNLIFLYFHTFIYSFFYIIPYLVFYIYFVENKIKIYYLGFILTSTCIGNFISKIIINSISEKMKIKVIFYCICFILSFVFGIISNVYIQDKINNDNIKNFFIMNLVSRFIYGFSCGRLTTRKYIIQFLPESEIKFFSLVYILIIYIGMLSGVLINFKLKDMKPLFIWSFYIDKYASIFAIGAFASFLYLILIFIFFTEPTKASMLNQIRTELNKESNEKIEEVEERISINEEKDVYDYKEFYDENETKDDTKKIFNYIFRDNGSSNGRKTINKEIILVSKNLEENNNDIKNKTFDEKLSKGTTENLIESKDIIPPIESNIEKESDDISTPLNISSIKNKNSKNTTTLESSGNSNTITNKLTKNSSNNDLISAEEIKGLNSIEKELIEMNNQNNFDDVNLMPNELERIRRIHFKNNRSYLCSFFVFISILFLTNSINEFILMSAPICFLTKNKNGNLILHELNMVIIIFILQFFSFPFIIFIRMMKAFNVERRLLFIFFATLSGLMIFFLICKIFFYETLDNSGENIYNYQNVLYQTALVIIYILSNFIEGTTHLLSNKIIPTFVKICNINNRYLISTSTVFGKILGGLIFCILCLKDEDKPIFEGTNIFKYNIYIFSVLTIILFIFFVFSYNKLRVRAISKLFYIND